VRKFTLAPFSVQFPIYFEIKQWFLSDIRKMNIIMSIFMQTVKKSPEKTLKETQRTTVTVDAMQNYKTSGIK
jgi:hypothetical protein